MLIFEIFNEIYLETIINGEKYLMFFDNNQLKLIANERVNRGKINTQIQLKNVAY